MIDVPLDLDLGDGYGVRVAVAIDGEAADVALDVYEPGDGAGCWMPPQRAREVAEALLRAAEKCEAHRG